jgi:hypothetical protein
LVNIPSKSDKPDFVNTLQNDLKKAKASFRTLTLDASFENNLPNVLVQTKENIIVPTSGDMASLRLFLDIMKRLPQENGNYTTRLFGYPEWQTYDSKFKTDFIIRNLIFTPFFVDEDDLETNEFLANFRKWYKRDPINLYPVMVYGDMTQAFTSSVRCTSTGKTLNPISIELEQAQSSMHFTSSAYPTVADLSMAVYFLFITGPISV